MNGRLQGFLSFLDLLAEGQRRQAEVVTGRRFEAPAGPRAGPRGQRGQVSLNRASETAFDPALNVDLNDSRER